MFLPTHFYNKYIVILQENLLKTDGCKLEVETDQNLSNYLSQLFSPPACCVLCVDLHFVAHKCYVQWIHHISPPYGSATGVLNSRWF